MNVERITKLVARSLGIRAADLPSRLRQAGAKDMAQVQALRRSAFGGQLEWDDTAYLNWRYSISADSGAHSTLLVFEHEARIAATVGVSHLPLTANEAPIDAVGIIDLAVDSELSGTGLGPWLNLAAGGSHDLALAIGSNENSRSTVEKLFKALTPRTTLVYPISIEPMVEARKWVPHALARVFRPADAWRARRLSLRVARQATTMTPISAFDDSHERMWRTMGARTGVCVRRTADLLNWRFFRNSRADYQGFVFLRQGAPAGHAILRISRLSDGRLEAVVADWSIAGDDSRTEMQAIFQLLFSQASQSGCAAVRITAYGPMQKAALRSIGFWEPRQSGKSAWGIAFSPAASIIVSPRFGPWHVTDLLSDGDGF
jgi:hypothetical protein